MAVEVRLVLSMGVERRSRRLEKVLAYSGSSKGRRPPLDPVPMLTAPVIHAPNDLSDERMGYPISGRLSFVHFQRKGYENNRTFTDASFNFYHKSGASVPGRGFSSDIFCFGWEDKKRLAVSRSLGSITPPCRSKMT